LEFIAYRYENYIKSEYLLYDEYIMIEMIIWNNILESTLFAIAKICKFSINFNAFQFYPGLRNLKAGGKRAPF
jgi:hypothetical protein